MKAVRLNFSTGELAVKDVPLPQPGRRQARVRVTAAGVCLSDVHLIDGTLRVRNAPEELTLGHEVAGVIDELGPGLDGEWKVGDRVTLNAGQRCGECRACLNFELCTNSKTRGVHYDGGWAEYTLAEAHTMVAVPDMITDEEACIIPDAVSTPWASIIQTAAVNPVEAVGVWGVGGLGVHAVQLLRMVGAAPIIAVDPSPAARERAIEFGADLALDPGDPELAARISELTAGRMLDQAFDFAGVAAVRDQAKHMLRKKGRLIIVGIAPTDITITDTPTFTVLGQQIRGHYGSDPIHIKQLIELARLGRLSLKKSVTATMPLSEAPRAVELLATKQGNPVRLVLVP